MVIVISKRIINSYSNNVLEELFICRGQNTHLLILTLLLQPNSFLY